MAYRPDQHGRSAGDTHSDVGPTEPVLLHSAPVAGLRPLRRRGLSDSRGPVELAAFGGLAISLAGMALLAVRADPTAAVTVASAALALMVVVWTTTRQHRAIGDIADISCGQAPARPSANGAVARLDAQLTAGLERLEDVEWQIHERETRLVSLLDSQQEIVLRRDLEGRLTYVNKAYCSVFGGEAAEHLGTAPSHLGALDPPRRPDEAGPDWRRRRLELLATRDGDRWIAWLDGAVADRDGGPIEVQSVGRDVTLEQRIEAELAHARDAAEAANRAKSRFLAAVSHEIRTPMNGILGMAALLGDTETTAEQRTYIQAVDQSARTLLDLIDEILDFSKIEAGRMELSEAPFSIGGCLQDVVELLAPKAHEKGLEIAWSTAPNIPTSVTGDRGRVRQILMNLIGNAIKFTHSGGVSIEIARVEDAGVATGFGMAMPTGAIESGSMAIRISVEDTGPGLSAAAIGRLFVEFEQAGAPGTGRQSGTGLGLAISRRLARLMGGDILVNSTPGIGSSFSVVLPLQHAAIPANGARPAARADDTSGLQAHGRTVLLAFDRAIERGVLAKTLHTGGWDVLECGADAVEEVIAAARRRSPVRAVMIDADVAAERAAAIMMLVTEAAGNGTGDEAPPVRGIVLISPTERGTAEALRAHGYANYLVRPVRPDAVLARLRSDSATAGDDEADDRLAVALPPAERHGSTRSCRILLAEDNDINALLAQKVIEGTGHVAIRAADGRIAVEMLAATIDDHATRFDLVLMDVHMPRLDGLEAMAEIIRMAGASRGRWRPPPVAALTANAFAEDRARCLSAGMDDYLAKPFERGDLRRLVAKWVPQSARRD